MTMKECSFEPGLAVKISGVVPGTNYKRLIAHARSLDLCPSWAIIRGADGMIALFKECSFAHGRLPFSRSRHPGTDLYT